MHEQYIEHFKQIGGAILAKHRLGYSIELVNGAACGTTKIGIFRKNIKRYEIQYAYNHLDYDLGVRVYAVRDGHTNYQQVILPVDFQGGLNTYGYSAREIERMIGDIVKLEGLV